MSTPLWDIEVTFDLLRMNAPYTDLQNIIAFYDEMQGQEGAFVFSIDASLGLGPSLICRFADDSEDLEEFMERLWTLQSLKLQSVKE